MSLDNMEDKELYDALQRAGLIDKLTNSEEWMMLREAGNRIVDRAINQFMETPANDTLKIMELQVIIRKYRRGLFQEVESLKRESTMLFEEAKERGLVGRAYDFVEEKIFG